VAEEIHLFLEFAVFEADSRSMFRTPLSIFLRISVLHSSTTFGTSFILVVLSAEPNKPSLRHT
jgi:hypothetical protein